MLKVKEKNNLTLNEYEGSSELREKIEDVFVVPMPTVDHFWYIGPPGTSRRKKRSFVFGKKDSSSMPYEPMAVIIL